MAELELLDEAMTERIRELSMELLIEKARVMRLKEEYCRIYNVLLTLTNKVSDNYGSTKPMPYGSLSSDR